LVVVGWLRRFDAQEFTEVSDVEAFFAELIAWTSAGASCDIPDFIGSEFHQVVVFAIRPTLNEE
jgi:hypothetical protein